MLLGLALGACGQGGREADGSLEAAEGRWADAGITDYTLTVTFGCFCIRERVGPFEVDVSAGDIVEVRFDGDILEPEPGVTPVKVFTVEGLFAEVRANQDAAALTVEYDDHGVPTLIDIDRLLEAVDDEVTITASIAIP
ncbi:MAG TPA: DUF6174 domain-containing protein [Acidimicrobiia bacterium]|nr:DUF6174 domain-containing protein [Acidimicrobiia bacterium]